MAIDYRLGRTLPSAKQTKRGKFGAAYAVAAEKIGKLTPVKRENRS